MSMNEGARLYRQRHPATENATRSLEDPAADVDGATPPAAGRVDDGAELYRAMHPQRDAEARA